MEYYTAGPRLIAGNIVFINVTHQQVCGFHWNWLTLSTFANAICVMKPVEMNVCWNGASLNVKREWRQSLLSPLIDSWSLWQLGSLCAKFWQRQKTKEEKIRKMQGLSTRIPRCGCWLYYVSFWCSASVDHNLWHLFEFFVMWLLQSFFYGGVSVPQTMMSVFQLCCCDWSVLFVMCRF